MSIEMMLISEGCRRTTSHKPTYTPNTTRCFTQEENSMVLQIWTVEGGRGGWVGEERGAQQNTFS